MNFDGKISKPALQHSILAENFRNLHYYFVSNTCPINNNFNTINKTIMARTKAKATAKKSKEAERQTARKSTPETPSPTAGTRRTRAPINALDAVARNLRSRIQGSKTIPASMYTTYLF